MEVKGMAFAARQKAVVQEFGEARWNQFIKKLAKKDSFFANAIFPSTMIPVASFLTFVDAMVKEFYGRDIQVHWRMGESSAEWSLKEGPYQAFLQARDLASFVHTTFPAIWRAYYTEGKLEGRLEGNSIRVIISELPVNHPFFELSVMGYVKKTIELFGIKEPQVVRQRGIESGEIEYLFNFES